jgi:predicted nucleic acid-binding protein
MSRTNPSRPRVLVDADVLFAGAASPSQHGASLTILRMAEITLIEAMTLRQVISEAERNLTEKLPQALPAFQLLVHRCLNTVPDPLAADLVAYRGLADPKDLPILVTALQEACQWLVTFNVRDYQPGHADVRVVRPGEFVQRVRGQLAHL